MKNIKFKTIISLALISYIVLIASQLVNEWEDMKLGFIQGFNTAKQEDINITGYNTYFITVIPKESVLSFPEKIQNFKFNEEINFRYNKLKVIYPVSTNLTLRLKIYKVMCTLLSFILVAVFVYIPFQFYGLMKSLQKEIFFDIEIKKRFNKIGIALMTAYWSTLLANYLFFQLKKSLFAFENYEIVKEHTNVIWLVLSFLFIILAEMISRGVKMKEDQELTI